MQLKRSYSRRLKVEIDFYEYYFIARHAYSSIGLAVKTSRPRHPEFISGSHKTLSKRKETANVILFLLNPIIHNILQQYLYQKTIHEVCLNQRT